MPTIEQVKDQLVTYFQQHPSALVTGIGIGSQPDNIQPEEQQTRHVREPWILIFVEPAPDCELQAVWEKVRAQAQGKPFLLLLTSRFAGLQATTGTSAGCYAPFRYNVPPATVGTLGAVLLAGGKQYILGSNHVMAYNGRVPLGTSVVAPSTLDDPYGRTAIGRLSHVVELRPAEWPLNGKPENHVDCALAEVTPAGGVNLGQTVQLFPSAVGTLTRVKKNGRTTQSTQSVMCIWSLTVCMDLSFGTYFFTDLMGTLGVIQQGVLGPGPFASPGDSGALVLTHPGDQGVGLIMARAYCSGVFSPNPAGTFPLPPPGAFVGYIVALCSLRLVRDTLARELGVPKGQIEFSQ